MNKDLLPLPHSAGRENALIVLHALWDALAPGKLHIWAESSSMPTGFLASTSTRRAADAQQPRPHPFALTAHDALAEAVSGLVGNLPVQGAGQETLTLRLPSTNKEPLSSPELLWDTERNEAQAAKELRWWTVNTITLDASHALDMLLSLPNDLPYGVALGSAMRFWATVANFSYELMVRQCYVPTLQELQRGRMTSCRAMWEAILTSEDAERLSTLAAMMPPLCWSLLPQGDKKASLREDFVRNFLNQTIDAFVRDSLSTTSLLLGKGNRRISAKVLPEQWLKALSSENSTLTGSADELNQFTTSMRTWLGQLQPVVSDAPFRTCFRLDPPATEENSINGANGTSKNEAWHVSFHLQANDDRSLLVPAGQVWQERSSTLTFLKRTFENPQERLLADLGRASRLFSPIEESLKEARPQELALTTEEAYTFLRQSAPLLEQSGFGVLVPPWWQKKSTRLRVKLKIKPKAGTNSEGLLGLAGLVDYDWSAAIGDTTLSEQEFEHLVNLKMPLIQIRGQWVELQPEEIEAAIAFFKKKHAGNMSLGDALRLGLGQEQTEVGLQVTEVEAEGWIQHLLAGLADGMKIETINVPSTLQGTLRPYQLKGVSWMTFLRKYGLGACLADDMGMGKCLGADSLVTVNGSLLKAEDIWSNYAEKAIFDGEGYWANSKIPLLTNSIDEVTGKIVQTSFKRLYRQHISEHLRKIRLEDGSCITITQVHKLLTDKGWTSNLHVGDYACVPAKLIWNGESEDADVIKVLAWQIAEGYEPSGQSTTFITQKDISVLEDLKQCFDRISERYSIATNRGTICQYGKKTPYLRVTSQRYKNFLDFKGYQWGYLSANKRIPDFIMQADLDMIRVFLRNFFQAEASVVWSMRSIEISTASLLLIQQLSYLLRRFGIWLRISTKQKRATNGTGILRPYHIGVLGGNAARKFCQEIGFAGNEKQEKLEKICELVSNTNVEGIPASEIMAQTVAATKLPIRHFGMPTVYVTGSQQFSPTSVRRVITGLDAILSGEAEREYRKAYGTKQNKWTVQTLAAYAQLDHQILISTRKRLQQLVDQEVYYCRIKEIEDVEYDGWVYDFEVENHHNFVANNILCHNTVQLTTLLLQEHATSKFSLEPTLVICPMSIVGNWQRELQRFAPSLRVMMHHGHERLSGQAFEEEARMHDVVITTYSLALRDKEHLGLIEWDNVVIDEAQNIKNESAKQTQAIKQLKAQYKIALTGTPVENRLSELWSIMEFLNPGYLGSGDAFRKSFAIPIERHHNAERAETLKRLIQPFVLRRVKTDKEIIKDLPDKMEMKVFCNLTQEQASLYEAVVKDMMEKIEAADGIERKGLILATLTKLKQVCNHPAQFMSDGSSLPRRSGKLERLEEMLEEVLAAGDKALIFTQYAQMGALLRTYLQETLGCETLFLHGGVQKKQRDIMVQRFQEERRGAPLFILSLKAGGVGLNLTAANHVFHFDRWWNPAVENQATDRAFRIGQQRNVQVHKFVCAGTLEERIDMMIEQKKVLAESIVGSGENWLTEMSTNQLKELFALSRDAVAE